MIIEKQTVALTKNQFTKLYNKIRKFKFEPLVIKDNDIEIKYLFQGDLSGIDYDEEMKQYVYGYYFFDNLKTSNQLIRKIYEYDPQAFDDLLAQEYKTMVVAHERRCNNALTELLESLTVEEKEAWETMKTFDDDYSIETVYETYLDNRCRVNEVQTELSRALELVKSSGYYVVKKENIV
jgi:hypothetical protein